ncbi:ankyrin repeat-containing protein At5g02620-like isoform X5 [Fagus crenata]
MSKLKRDGVGRSLERILEKQPTEVQTVAAANTAERNEMTQVALDRNDKERTEIIHRVADINFVVATIIASATFSAVIQVPGGFDDKGLAILGEKNNFYFFVECDTAAFSFSIFSMFIHFWAAPFRKSIETADVGFHSAFLRLFALMFTGGSLFFFAISFYSAAKLVSSQTLADDKNLSHIHRVVGGLVAPECVPGLVLSRRRFVL